MYVHGSHATTAASGRVRAPRRVPLIRQTGAYAGTFESLCAYVFLKYAVAARLCPHRRILASAEARLPVRRGCQVVFRPSFIHGDGLS
jgi:hypothetical protein